MKLHSIIDEKKKQLVRDAIARGDTSVFGTKKKPSPDQLSESRTWGSVLEVFIPRANGVSFEEALARAKAAGRIIASNKRLDQALVGSKKWETIKDAFACWTGTMIAYEETGKPFERSVEYVDDKTGIRHVFPVPDLYVGLKNCLLVTEHPYYSLETDGNNKIVRPARVELIAKFPAATQKWYLTDPKYGIPLGEETSLSNPDARCLIRISKRVGPVARGGYGNVGSWHRGVLAGNGPSDALGVAVEPPERGTLNKPGDKP